MEVFAEGAYPEDATRTAVTIGVYDGVHVGHRHVLQRLRETAAARGLRTAVVTFDPHPASIVAPERAPLLLTSVERRLELLAELGIDRCVVVGFDESVATEPPASFVERVLVDELHAAVVVVGEDFRFGHDRAGDVALLRAVAGSGGFDVEPVALDGAGGEPISSSRIRALLADGDVAGAAALLGRPHELEGTVVRGDGRGRALGYPTANLDVDADLVIPAIGIYAGTWTRPTGASATAAISVGRRPTFYEDGELLVEAYLCDVDADLYGERSRLAFVERLRGEQKFDTVDDLVAQITKDVDQSKALLAR
ncbi:MAG TPA: bifunctional riboflavin kinase/FAD synthetase [Acidimicrobiales bacterium]|jgi:riboflavin kinase/FMN adenylyltransferase|nr:bifunctional riboflavin kinase/FAD synthetase [Acidimicrobiales bacterium]